MEPIEIKVSKRKSKDEIWVLDDLPSLPFRTLLNATTATNAAYNTFNKMIQQKCLPYQPEVRVFVGDRMIGPRETLDREVFQDIFNKVPESHRRWEIQWWAE